MPHQVPRRPPRPPRRPSGGERVFTDEAGRLWSAAPHRPGPNAGITATGAAVVFACISDARERMRAIAVDPAVRLAEAADDTLRVWLRDAPPMGRLT
jgi:hypothetical protein